MIKLQTSLGDITIKLDNTNTPITAENFENLVKEGHYNGTIFHRVINGFMIQGGGFDGNMKQKETSKTIKNEAKSGKPNKRGTIAMARTSDPHSAGAQFFINVKDNDFLNFTSESTNGWGYCVFGEVVEGMEVVDKIKAAKTQTRGMHQDVPVEAVTLETASLIEG